MIFDTEQEPISKPQRKLTWIDAILPTLVAFGGGILLLYVLGRLIEGYIFGFFLMFMFYPGFLRSLALIPVAIIVVLVSVMYLALRWKARGRETEPSFYLPSVVLVCGFLLVPVFLYKPKPTPPTPAEIAARQLREFKQKLNDPDFVMNLKGPLPMERLLALMADIDHADGSSSHWKPEELHALLLNIGTEIEPSVARCAKTWPDDLHWLAQHGSIGGRRGAAMNSHTREDDVRSLLTDSDAEVRYFAKRNAAQRICDPRLLQSIYFDDKQTPHGDSEITGSLAKNPCTPRSILGFLTGEPYPAVRQSASSTLKSLSSR